MAIFRGSGATGSIWRWRPGLLARNSGYALLWQLFRAACLALYLWLLARKLGPAQYGLLVAVLALATIAGTLNGGGVGVLLLRQGVHDPASGAAAWNKSCAAIVVGFSVCFILFAAALHGLIPVPMTGSIWIPLGIAEIGLNALSGAAASGLQSREKLGWSGALLALPPFGRLLAAASLSLLATPGLSAYAMLHLVFALVGCIIALSVLPPQRTAGKLFDLAEGWRWWLQGSGFAAMYLVALAAVDFDKSLVLRNSDAATAGHYALGYRVVMTFALPVTALVQALMPRLVKQIAAAQEGPARTTFVATVAVICYSLIAALALGQFGGALIQLFGNAYARLDTVIPGFCVLLVIYNLRCVAGVLLYAENRPWSRTAIEGIAIGLVFVCSAALVPRYGLAGALATAMISETWICLISWMLAIRVLRSREQMG